MEKRIGEILKRLRQERGFSQREVAQRVSKNLRTIQRLEGGKIKDISLPLILAYLETIGISPLLFFSELLGKEEKKLEIAKRELPISFPEHYLKMIADYLFAKGIKKKEKYLQFAREYFASLAHLSPIPLSAISEKYQKENLDQVIWRKVKKMTISAFNWAAKVKFPKKDKKFGKRGERYRRVLARAKERVKRLIFRTKGATRTSLRIHLGFLSATYGLVKGSNGRPSPGEIEEWIGKKEKEGGDRKILAEMVKIMIEEYRK
ncbi:MAG: transcriptional regulator [candidate division WOR-3 bacterium]